jgi:hypothetical protein
MCIILEPGDRVIAAGHSGTVVQMLSADRVAVRFDETLTTLLGTRAQLFTVPIEEVERAENFHTDSRLSCR